MSQALESLKETYREIESDTEEESCQTSIDGNSINTPQSNLLPSTTKAVDYKRSDSIDSKSSSDDEYDPSDSVKDIIPLTPDGTTVDTPQSKFSYILNAKNYDDKFSDSEDSKISSYDEDDLSDNVKELQLPPLSPNISEDIPQTTLLSCVAVETDMDDDDDDGTMHDITPDSKSPLDHQEPSDDVKEFQLPPLSPDISEDMPQTTLMSCVAVKTEMDDYDDDDDDSDKMYDDTQDSKSPLTDQEPLDSGVPISEIRPISSLSFHQKHPDSNESEIPPEPKEILFKFLEVSSPPEPKEKLFKSLEVCSPPEPKEKLFKSLEVCSPPEPKEKLFKSLEVCSPPEPKEKLSKSLEEV